MTASIIPTMPLYKAIFPLPLYETTATLMDPSAQVAAVRSVTSAVSSVGTLLDVNA
jgi:hypothetical protein